MERGKDVKPDLESIKYYLQVAEEKAAVWRQHVQTQQTEWTPVQLDAFQKAYSYFILQSGLHMLARAAIFSAFGPAEATRIMGELSQIMSEAGSS